MSLYNSNEIDAHQRSLLKRHLGQVSREKLAQTVNAIEDLASLYNTLPEGKLKQEILELMNSFEKQANDNDIDIGRTLVNFYTLKDQNEILTNIKLLDIVDYGSTE